MAGGLLLTEFEIERGRKLYANGLTWREVGEAMRRDHSGLRRRCGGSRSMSEAQLKAWRIRKAIRRYQHASCA